MPLSQMSSTIIKNIFTAVFCVTKCMHHVNQLTLKLKKKIELREPFFKKIPRHLHMSVILLSDNATQNTANFTKEAPATCLECFITSHNPVCFFHSTDTSPSPHTDTILQACHYSLEVLVFNSTGSDFYCQDTPCYFQRVKSTLFSLYSV